MGILRDPFWQSVGAVTAILALLLYVYVERDKISKLYTETASQLRNILARLGKVPPAIVNDISTILSALFLLLLGVFILFVPYFLYKELVQHQLIYVDSSTVIDDKSMFYGLVVIAWCLSIMTFSHKLIINKLQDQIDYLNRIPGIQELKNQYNTQLFDSVIRQWADFRYELVNKHDDSPFAMDLAACSPLVVQNETLIISCPNRVIYNRMTRIRIPTTGADEEYEQKKRDKRMIEELIRERFQLKRINYTLKQSKK